MFRLFLMLALLAMPTQRALALERPPEGSEVQLFIENDLLARTDRYYTNGIKFGGGMGFDLLQLPAAEFLRQVAPEAAGKVHLGLFLGQNLYTPRAIGVSQAQPLDRPWAAWLYLGGVAQRARDNRLDTVEIDLGLVGPSALGPGNPVGLAPADRFAAAPRLAAPDPQRAGHPGLLAGQEQARPGQRGRPGPGGDSPRRRQRRHGHDIGTRRRPAATGTAYDRFRPGHHRARRRHAAEHAPRSRAGAGTGPGMVCLRRCRPPTGGAQHLPRRRRLPRRPERESPAACV
ncbi:MAG: DUF2219 family protein [Sulfuritalea sp.]|nr:DUF2219 family protein [Sulfuritalea sp.]